MLACDLVVASRTARFGVPEVKRALVAGAGRRAAAARAGAAADRAGAAAHRRAHRRRPRGRARPGQPAHRRGRRARRCRWSSPPRSRPTARSPSRSPGRSPARPATGPARRAGQKQDELMAPVFTSEDAIEGATAFAEKRDAGLEGPLTGTGGADLHRTRHRVARPGAVPLRRRARGRGRRDRGGLGRHHLRLGDDPGRRDHRRDHLVHRPVAQGTAPTSSRSRSGSAGPRASTSTTSSPSGSPWTSEAYAEPVRPTLYEYAGGDAAFLRLAQAHHERCLADPELNHPFSHDDLNPQHVERLAAYWAEVLGGPPRVLRGDGRPVVAAGHARQQRADGRPRAPLRRLLRRRRRRRRTARRPRVPAGAARLHGVGGRRRAGLRADGLAGPGRRADAALVVGRAAVELRAEASGAVAAVADDDRDRRDHHRHGAHRPPRPAPTRAGRRSRPAR